MAVYPERRGARLTGKWIAEVTQHGERRRKRFDTKLDGERWADFTKLTGAPPVEVEAAKPAAHTLHAVIREAKSNHAGWDGGRDKSLGQRLEFVERILGANTPIESIATTDLDKLVNTLKKRPGKDKRLNPQTINRYLAAASAVLKYARTRGYIAGMPVVPWQKFEKKRMHFLTPEAEAEVLAAMENAGDRIASLVTRVLTATGLRWSEFAGLTPDMIQGEWIKLGKTKTNTPRDVPIDAELAEELRGIIIRGEVPAYYTFRNALKRALKSAGQSGELSVHGLRHTTATRLVHGGVNLAVVKDFLGHSSLNTTLKYTHVTSDLLQQAAKKISPHAGQSTKSPISLIKKSTDNKGEVEATPGIEPGYADLQSET
jgi:integrase